MWWLEKGNIIPTNTPAWVFSKSLNCINGNKSRKALRIIRQLIYNIKLRTIQFELLFFPKNCVVWFFFIYFDIFFPKEEKENSAIKAKRTKGEPYCLTLSLSFCISSISIALVFEVSSLLLVCPTISAILSLGLSSTFFEPGISSQYKAISRTTITRTCLMSTLLVIIILFWDLWKKRQIVFDFVFSRSISLQFMEI